MCKITKVVTGLLEENCYIVQFNQTECFITDPGNDADKIIKVVNTENVKPLGIILTHGHFDHVDAVSFLKDYYGVPAYMNNSDLFFVDEKFNVEYDLSGIDEIPGTDIRVFSTPGHSKGSSCFLIGDNLICGDTLFAGTIGRCDLEGGSYKEMEKTLEFIVNNFDVKTRLFPGHGPDTTLEYEMRYNPYLVNIKKL